MHDEGLRDALIQVMALVTNRTDGDYPEIDRIVQDALLTHSTAQLKNSVYHHLKRGSDYRIESVVEIQASTGPLYEGDLAVIYRSVDGLRGFGRKLIEFNDGRFIRIEERKKDDGEFSDEIVGSGDNADVTGDVDLTTDIGKHPTGRRTDN